MKATRIFFLGGSALASIIPFATASAVPITSSTVSDVLQWNDFFTGSSGAPLATDISITCREADVACETNLNTGLATSSANGVGVKFTEPGSGAASDYVFAWNGFIAFASDDESGQFSGLPTGFNASDFFSLSETGDLIDITTHFAGLCTSNGGTPCGFNEGTLLFASDVSDVHGVPEPASWVVMLTGLLSLFGFGALRKRADA